LNIFCNKTKFDTCSGQLFRPIRPHQHCYSFQRNLVLQFLFCGAHWSYELFFLTNDNSYHHFNFFCVILFVLTYNYRNLNLDTPEEWKNLNPNARHHRSCCNRTWNRWGAPNTSRLIFFCDLFVLTYNYRNLNLDTPEGWKNLNPNARHHRSWWRKWTKVSCCNYFLTRILFSFMILFHSVLL